MLRRTKARDAFQEQELSRIHVLCCSGHDPTGGAGIQADIEAVAAREAHTLALITALTVQDTCNVTASEAVAPELLQRQIDCLLEDCPVSAIKIGLLGSAEQLPVIAALLERCRVPVVMDPILRAGGGKDLPAAKFRDAVIGQLFPRCTLLTPNAAEARCWTGEMDLDAAGRALLSWGAQNVLITGGDEADAVVFNRWYRHGGIVRVFEMPRLPGSYHGAGCSLAATIAARLALGQPMEDALERSQKDVHRMLQAARTVGRGRALPRRILASGP